MRLEKTAFIFVRCNEGAVAGRTLHCTTVLLRRLQQAAGGLFWHTAVPMLLLLWLCEVLDCNLLSIWSLFLG
jgi:hypothetical protein